MPFLEMDTAAGKKRKRSDRVLEKKHKSKKTANSSPEPAEDQDTRIIELEAQIIESRRHYNNIAALLSIARPKGKDAEASLLAMVALCRVYCRLLAAGSLGKSKGAPESELVIVQWLKERLNEYVDLLVELMNSEEPDKQTTALALGMRLVKEEVNHHGPAAWDRGVFSRVIARGVLKHGTNAELLRDEFIAMYFQKYGDIRFHTFELISLELRQLADAGGASNVVGSSIQLLSRLESPANGNQSISNFFLEPPKNSKHQLHSLSAHKNRAQSAWMAVLACSLSKEQRKTILRSVTHSIVPWFTKPELLMDFLTDSYNIGGATSLLALSGLFYLMQEKNLDYPSFYSKLYSLLDDELLHSKHRSRFFRLLDTFMSSTHLPAALVASFIKRLARLALHAPPGGIVIVIPWIYNMFKKHPQCTFMMHREPSTEVAKQEIEERGFKDPFSMEEPDPMETGAIDSSIWEIETLQSHYHPNVATLANIISEQFTKQSYNLEDFLDHSYNSLLEAELGKDMKKPPVVEYQIPKYVFTGEDTELNRLGTLMAEVLESNKST